MEDNLIPLGHLGFTEDELFSPIDADASDAERISAPKYSYWRSVFRVFFSNKLNAVILILLAVIILETVVSMVVGTVISFISNMKIEEKYGFNKTSIKTFIIKSI